jgi:hypothetical protein
MTAPSQLILQGGTNLIQYSNHCINLPLLLLLLLLLPLLLLQGVLYHDRMKSSELEKVRPELVALEQAFAAANPDVPIQRVPPPAAAKAKGFGSVAKR